VASKLTKVTPVAIIWQVRKTNLAGDGVTGALYVNGMLLDSITIAGNNGTNPSRRYYVNLSPNDIVDVVLTPQGLTTRADGSDGSITWFWVDTRMPANPRQPDGTPFVPAGGLRFDAATFDAVQRQITLAWPSTANTNYTIESSDDLTTWTVLRTNLPSAGSRTTFSEALDAAKRTKFYRLRQ
jgi:hypothetical protein